MITEQVKKMYIVAYADKLSANAEKKYSEAERLEDIAAFLEKSCDELTLDQADAIIAWVDHSTPAQMTANDIIEKVTGKTQPRNGEL